nr:DivIVA domain-containing protein [Flaviflexus huanghaiensis]
MRRGYSIEDVDEYFANAKSLYQEAELPPELDPERIRTVAFPLVRGGYRTLDVDQALERLERACRQRERASVVTSKGTEAWLERTYTSASTLYPRLGRPRGERFRPPAKGRGYSRPEVDDLVDRLAKYFDGSVELVSDELLSASFSLRGKSRAYDVNVVDVYLDRAISVLQAVE